MLFMVRSNKFCHLFPFLLWLSWFTGLAYFSFRFRTRRWRLQKWSQVQNYSQSILMGTYKPYNFRENIKVQIGLIWHIYPPIVTDVFFSSLISCVSSFRILKRLNRFYFTKSTHVKNINYEHSLLTLDERTQLFFTWIGRRGPWSWSTLLLGSFAITFWVWTLERDPNKILIPLKKRHSK